VRGSRTGLKTFPCLSYKEVEISKASSNSEIQREPQNEESSIGILFILSSSLFFIFLSEQLPNKLKCRLESRLSC
jgi:hypothetical protein